MNTKGTKRLLAGLLAAVLLLPFAVSAAPESGEETTPQTGEPAREPAALQDGYTVYAAAGDLTLYVNEKEAMFAVEDGGGRVWTSTPPAYEEDEIASGDVRRRMASLVELTYADSLANTNTLNGRKHCVEEGTFTVQKIDGGVRFNFRFESRGFVIPLEVRLREDGVELSLVTEEIEETMENYQLLRVSVAPYFSAAGAQEEGYILVPDGSGALIGLQGNNGYTLDYSQYVYGRDAATTQLEAGAVTENVRLPVFGMKHGDTGFAGIITAGASRAILNAAVQGKRSSYSNVYTEFIYRDTDLVLVEKKNERVRMVESAHTALPRQTVRYVLLTGEDADYVGMAEAYREYLLDEGGLTPRVEAGSAPLVVELFGGVMTQQYVWGFPVKRVAPLTTYEDAQQILAALKDAGVEQVLLNYTYWNKDGTGAALQTALKPEGRLGGSSGLKELATYCREQDTPLYLSVNTNTMVKSAWGYNKKSDAASSVQRNPAMQYNYELNTGEAEVSSPTFLLTPQKLPELAQKLAGSADSYGIAGLSTSFLGNTLYSDFGKRAIPRDRSEEIWKEALTALAGATGSLLVDGGSAYALESASFITAAPTDSSRYLMETEEIPFYQIVLHGIVPMSVGSLNERSDARQGLLKAVETGSCLQYRWLARNETELQETDYDTVISARYTDWLDTAAEQYREAAELLQSVADQTIADHERLSRNVTRTTYADGTAVTVNFGPEAVTVDGVELAAESFLVDRG
ncbi:MAG TPA: hypothetical protein H9684_09465 [Firmicutes bacterium]|nr:hypothetical protein [Bacillota bacterium]